MHRFQHLATTNKLTNRDAFLALLKSASYDRKTTLRPEKVYRTHVQKNGHSLWISPDEVQQGRNPTPAMAVFLQLFTSFGYSFFLDAQGLAKLIYSDRRLQ